MKKHLVTVLVLLLFPVFAYAEQEKWDNQEKALGGSFIAGQVINYGQTRWVQEHDDWHEINSVLKHVVKDSGTKLVAWKALTTGSVLVGSHYLNHEWRKRVLWASNIVVFGFVGHDLVVGVGWKFK